VHGKRRCFLSSVLIADQLKLPQIKRSWRHTGVAARHNSTADVTSGWYTFMLGVFWHHARNLSAVAVASASLSTFDMCAGRGKE
jgi:hypothetical protein